MPPGLGLQWSSAVSDSLCSSSQNYTDKLPHTSSFIPQAHTLISGTNERVYSRKPRHKKTGEACVRERARVGAIPVPGQQLASARATLATQAPLSTAWSKGWHSCHILNGLIYKVQNYPSKIPASPLAPHIPKSMSAQMLSIASRERCGASRAGAAAPALAIKL